MKMINRTNIVFLASLPWERMAKLAMALRSKGVSVLLVYVTEPNNFDPREYFDYTIKADSNYDAVYTIHRLRPNLIHLFSYGADEVSQILFFNKIGKVVYDYKDCFENLLHPPASEKFFKAQRQCVENADGLCCRDLQLWNYCQVNGIRPKGKRILFLDYCWGENNKRKVSIRKDGEIHTVVAGHFSIEKANPVGADCGYLHTARVLADSGIHIHIYHRRHNKSLTDQKHMDDYFELAEKSPYCHLHEPVPMSTFVQELSQYDYGLGIYQGHLFPEIGITSCINEHERHATASRYFDYLEAGLDILMTPEIQFCYRLMRNASVAFPATPKLFLQDDAKKVLSSWRGQHTQLRINAARERFDIHNNIDRLIDFYRSL